MQEIFIYNCSQEIAYKKDCGSRTWSTAETSKFLGKSERSVRRLLQTGVIKGKKVIGPTGYVWQVEPLLHAAPASSETETDLSENESSLSTHAEPNFYSTEANYASNQCACEHASLQSTIDTLTDEILILKAGVDRYKKLYESVSCENVQLMQAKTESPAKMDLKQNLWQTVKQTFLRPTTSVAEPS